MHHFLILRGRHFKYLSEVVLDIIAAVAVISQSFSNFQAISNSNRLVISRPMSRRPSVNITKLIEEHNLIIDNDLVPDNLKCVKCRSVLNDAVQLGCGCAFCRACIDVMLATGAEFCPGVAANCDGSLLSNSVPDYRANLHISKLPVKCPQRNCEFATDLGAIEDHLRVCSRATVKCPFYEWGCKRDKVPVDEIDEHFQQASWSHSTIVAEMIAHIDNEAAECRRAGLADQREIETLKFELVRKTEETQRLTDELRHADKRIEALSGLIQEIKDENDRLVEQVRTDRDLLEVRLNRSELIATKRAEYVNKELGAIRYELGGCREQMEREVQLVQCEGAEMRVDIDQSMSRTNELLREEIEALRAQIKTITQLLVDRRKKVAPSPSPLQSPSAAAAGATPKKAAANQKPQASGGGDNDMARKVEAVRMRFDKEINESLAWLIEVAEGRQSSSDESD